MSGAGMQECSISRCVARRLKINQTQKLFLLTFCVRLWNAEAESNSRRGLIIKYVQTAGIGEGGCCFLTMKCDSRYI